MADLEVDVAGDIGSRGVKLLVPAMFACLEGAWGIIVTAHCGGSTAQKTWKTGREERAGGRCLREQSSVEPGRTGQGRTEQGKA